MTVIILLIIIFTIFLLLFFLPRKRRDWIGVGIAQAFLISFIFEMFGFAFTFYVLVSLGIITSGANPVYELMNISPEQAKVFEYVGLFLIFFGSFLVFLGWKEIYSGKGKLVTKGIYGFCRHPQYLGLILIATGFLVFWPNILTLIMWFVLIIAYYKLAKIEERELLKEFGEEYKEYKKNTPMFFWY